MTKRHPVSAAKDLAGGFIKALKARGQEVGVWEARGRIFSRLLVTCRDARLSGAEWSVMSTLALHLAHLGRSKGMMSVGSLAKDCMVTERTIRNVLRVLAATKFIIIKFRASGQIEIWLDRRFGPRIPVPGDKSANGERRRCAPRKKISTTGTPLRVVPVKRECTDSAPNARRESSGSVSLSRTTTAKTAPQDALGPKLAVSDIAEIVKQTIERMNSGGSPSGSPRPGSAAQLRSVSKLAVPKCSPRCSRIIHAGAAYEWHEHDPPRKRAVPVPSG